ncbi:MAG: methylated-DNA--[protein]-cysteine S-methyltransferase [Oscillospiraceae bacterium]
MIFSYKSKVSELWIEEDDGKLIGIGFVKPLDKIVTEQPTPCMCDVIGQLGEYFAGKRKIFDVKFDFKGTSFQQKVWKQLTEIPYGSTVTYKDIAEKIGSPKAYRAVGMACNKNPMVIIVPCHRVIGVGGKMMGYAGGISVKKELLELENS